jgi:hypothetical protein
MMFVKTVVLAIALTFLPACASPKPATSSNDNPSGKWSGDYGTDSSRREPISVELRWEDNSLRGVVQAGFRGLPISKGSYQPETGAISLEFEAQGNGQKVHYVIDGKVSGNTMTGTWAHDDQHGDFRVIRE